MSAWMDESAGQRPVPDFQTPAFQRKATKSKEVSLVKLVELRKLFRHYKLLNIHGVS